jgi:predicted secreted Zn-dependent protease
MMWNVPRVSIARSDRIVRGRVTALCLATACLSQWPAHAEWRAVETVRTYAVTGMSGPELYASIGERGPKDAGGRRAIAHTNFKLTWTRTYEVQHDSCVLTSARPKLTITYVLPKPAKRLPAALEANWDRFAAGVAAHERVHGDMIRDLVREIESATAGLSAPADPQCRKIRAEMTRRLSAISAAHRKRNREFDEVELSKGGNVHQLILALVNGR